MIIIMQLQLKQKYLISNNPQKISFEEERTKNFQKILLLITTTDRKQWLSTGFNCGSFIESYKQVYGLTSDQFQLLITIFANIGLKEEGLSTETRVFVLKAINAFAQFQIKITKNFKISNKKIIEILQSYATEGVEGTLKNSDAVVDQLSKFAYFFSRFGEQVVEEALALSIEYNDIRYLVVLIRSLKNEASALRLLTELFSDNNLWDRDCFWFFILSEIVKKFPRIDYSSYYHTIMQQAIRIFTTLIEPDSEDSLKKIVATDPFLQIQSTIKSVALILAYLLLPQSYPQHVFIKSCIQRLFNLVITSLDHTNPPDYINDLLGFTKSFVRAYLLRYRSERGLFSMFNEDTIDDYHVEINSKELLIDQSTQQFFDNLWQEIIPRIVFYEDAQQCKPSKILAQLSMYKPEKFLQISLRSVFAVVNRDDPTLISLHGAKISILFLQEYVIVQKNECLSLYIECCSSILRVLQKIGVPENLDILELVLRTFIYLNKEQMNLKSIKQLIEDLMQVILTNIESISIGLQDTQDGEELYISFSNIFFPFLLQLDQAQIFKFTDKFLYKLINQIPEHQEGYKMISVVVTYINDKFPGIIIKHILKQLISQKEQHKMKAQGKEQKVLDWKFVKQVKGVFHAKNEQTLKWYATLLQCIIQYHPKNIIKHWNSIENIVNLLLIEWQDQNYMQIALDILYNVILCLCKPQLDPKEFTAEHNRQYRTLKLNWIQITPEVKQLIDYIYQAYFVNIETYLRKTYGEELKKNEAQVTILADFDTYYTKHQKNDTIRIRNRNLKLVDFILLPNVTNPEDTENKKSIYRALSIQYTVMSALMIRIPFYADIQNIGNFFTEDKYKYLRKRSCQYLQWVLQLLGNFNLLGQEAFIKLFNYFWRESHDQVSFSAGIDSMNEKITPFFYPQIHRRKEILRSSFLIVNEAYLSYMARLEFYLVINPIAHLNNPRYLESNFILGLNPLYQPSLHSYFPSYIEVHQYHRELIAICRHHLDPNNVDGYLYKMLKQTDPSTKERYNIAVKALIVSIKKLLNVFSDVCCMQDEFIRNTIFELISLYKILQKKIDKTLIYQLVYVMLVFSFDPLCLLVVEDYSLTKYWSLKLQNSAELVNYEIASVEKIENLQNLITLVEETELQILSNMNNDIQLKLTRSCSFENDPDVNKQIQRAINYLINKIELDFPGIEKDYGIYLLLLLLYSNSIPIEHPLISQIIKLIFKLCQEQSQEIFNMSKTGLFHLVNRLNYSKRKSTMVDNTPIKRSWQQFLKFKYIGSDQPYQNLKCQKSEQNFYPSKKLLFCDYQRLAENPLSSAFRNEETLLGILQDEEGLLKFLKNCAKDPQLKQNEQHISEAMIVSEEDFKSVSSSAHKLMHFIWDCNPSKTPLFMGVLQRYQNSPLNFYNRFFRKILRISSDKTRNILMKIANTLRKGQNQEIRLSFYINCQLMLYDPENQLHKPFLDFIGQCSNDNFDYALMGIYGILTSNIVVAEKNYKVFLQRLRTLKGNCRFRHFDLLNTYMVSQGRFARGAAIEATELLLKGINQGSDEISQAVVSMITEVYVQAVNLKNINQWIEQPLSQLLKQKKIYILNENVGYNDEEHLVLLLTQLMKNAKNEEVSVESNKLKIYSQIVRKILASIAIFRFNDYFYKLLRSLILYVLERPQSLEDDSSDQFVISQLCDSQYPEQIYKDLLEQLLPMKDRTPYVVKKKLVFLQGLIIHRSFRLNKVEIPEILSKNEKIITFDYIIMISTIARLMKSEQITEETQKLLAKANRKKHETYKLIALLMASGVREYPWKEKILRDLVKHKKDKLVKECISQWWKGKTPQTPEELRLSELVRNFENPYSYFA